MFKYILLTTVFLTFFYSIGQTKADTDSSSVNQIKILKESLQAKQDSTTQLLYQGKYDKVIQNSIENIRLAESIGDTSAAYYSKYVIAITFTYLKDFKSAHEYADPYTEFAESVNDTTLLIRAYSNMGGIYFLEREHDSALQYYKKALPLILERQDPLEMAMIHYNFSEAYMMKEQYPKARIYLKKGKKVLVAANNTDLNSEFNVLEGKINLNDNKPKAAIVNFEAAIAHSESKDVWDNNLIETYKEYSNALYASGDLKEAFLARRKYDSLNNLQFEKDKVMAIQNATSQFGVNEYKKQAKQAELEKQLITEKVKQNRFLMYVFIGAAILMALFSIFIFLSSRKRKKLTLTLKEKNRQYLKAKDKSERLALAKSKFFSTVSHELRTPLYGVIGLTSILLEDKSLKNHETDLKNLKFSADYLLALINDVLQISKLESNTYDEIESHFEIHELIKAIEVSFEYILIQNKNRLHVHVSENIPDTIVGNRLRLSQILMNLLGNASKFTNNGDIYLTLNEEEIDDEDITISITVKDTGIGIPKNKQKMIFEEFQQVESQEYGSNGTGLGLSIVKKLLDSTNATINLESELGQGTSITITIPYKIAKNTIKENVVQSEIVLDGKEILIVDDNRINQIVTKKILENQGVSCSIAANGDEAIRLVEDINFDLILMDINMPGKNGIETTKEIRKFNISTPILALTAIEVEEMRKTIEDSGMSDIIVKPYDVDKFLNIILKNLNHKEKMLDKAETTSFS